VVRASRLHSKAGETPPPRDAIRSLAGP